MVGGGGGGNRKSKDKRRGEERTADRDDGERDTSQHLCGARELRAGAAAGHSSGVFHPDDRHGPPDQPCRVVAAVRTHLDTCVLVPRQVHREERRNDDPGEDGSRGGFWRSPAFDPLGASGGQVRRVDRLPGPGPHQQHRKEHCGKQGFAELLGPRVHMGQRNRRDCVDVAGTHSRRQLDVRRDHPQRRHLQPQRAPQAPQVLQRAAHPGHGEGPRDVLAPPSKALPQGPRVLRNRQAAAVQLQAPFCRNGALVPALQRRHRRVHRRAPEQGVFLHSRVTSSTTTTNTAAACRQTNIQRRMEGKKTTQQPTQEGSMASASGLSQSENNSSCLAVLLLAAAFYPVMYLSKSRQSNLDRPLYYMYT